MQIQWRELATDGSPDDSGLAFEVAGATAPGVGVQVCNPRCLRVSVSDVPRLWARIDDDYWGYEVLRSGCNDSLRILDPIEFTVVHRLAQLEGLQWLRAWTRTFVDMLSESAASPLTNGNWRLRPGGNGEPSQLPPTLITKIVAQQPIGYAEWDFGDYVYPITLRDVSPPDAGRVKAWRKFARSGKLPPILLMWVSGLDAHVVLDGHDRLLAASAEGTSATALSLGMYRTTQPHPDVSQAILAQVAAQLAAGDAGRARTADQRLARATRFITVQQANDLLIRAFAPSHFSAPTQARALDGGFSRWSQEVESALLDRGIRERPLLRTEGT